jgi:predicted phosphodiesterase
VRYVVLSDIHSNIDALDAVLEDARRSPADATLVLGDLVGYGAEPEQVISKVRALNPLAIVRGNHDKVVAGVDSVEGFNPLARMAVTLTRQALSQESLDYLAALPKGPLVVAPGLEICHGSPYDEDWYLHHELDVLEALEQSECAICLFGHTHLPFAATVGARGGLDVLVAGDNAGSELNLGDGRRYVVNPGSIGQPRDGDPRAAYGVLDTQAMRWEFRRVAYPVERARDRIFAAGFPRQLGLRLMRGR